jgi:predicted O-methyltransferase YrrM
MLRSVLPKPSTEAAYYNPVLLGPETLRRAATSTAVVRDVLGVLGKLEPDDYTRYLSDYCGEGLRRFGDAWAYADICTVLLATARAIAPRTYLEIGVRRGRSMAMVASAAPECALYGFDMWVEDYAGMPNPGGDFVKQEIQRTGHTGEIQMISGDSHVTVPRFLAEHAGENGLELDLVTVDGDHSYEGALADLREVIPRLSVGGVIVFDDIVHPKHPYLAEVWRRAVAEDGGLTAGEYGELGYGVAFAVRAQPPRAREPLAREAVRAARGQLTAIRRALAWRAR